MYLLRKTDECAICGHQFTDMKDVTVDHIIPLSRGGSNTIGNMQLAHEACNVAKGNLLPSEFTLEPVGPLLWVRGIPFELKDGYGQFMGLHWFRQRLEKALCAQRWAGLFKSPKLYSAINPNSAPPLNCGEQDRELRRSAGSLGTL